jgi:hypothetical protein
MLLESEEMIESLEKAVQVYMADADNVGKEREGITAGDLVDWLQERMQKLEEVIDNAPGPPKPAAK